MLRPQVNDIIIVIQSLWPFIAILVILVFLIAMLIRNKHKLKAIKAGGFQQKVDPKKRGNARGVGALIIMSFFYGLAALGSLSSFVDDGDQVFGTIVLFGFGITFLTLFLTRDKK